MIAPAPIFGPFPRPAVDGGPDPHLNRVSIFTILYSGGWGGRGSFEWKLAKEEGWAALAALRLANHSLAD
jgi:hypothetical protein